MMGYWTHSNFWEIYSMMHQIFPEFVSKKWVIGRTYEKNYIEAFRIGKSMDSPKSSKKNFALFMALHHAREPISLTMLFALFIGQLHDLYHNKSELLYSQIDLVFIPIVNVDTYKFINNSYLQSSPDWDKISFMRKNRRPCSETTIKPKIVTLGDSDNACNPKYNCGVDINRNYGYKFGMDDIGSDNDQCSDAYRGVKAFSEPETQAVRSFFQKNKGKIVSTVSFHSFGPLVLNGFNWDGEKNLEMQQNHPRHYKFNQDFKEASLKVHNMKTLQYGNSAQTLHYTANGETIDWVVKTYDIFGYTLEIANDNTETHGFYAPQNLLADVIKDFYPILQLYLDYHKTDLKNVRMLVEKRTPNKQMIN